MSYYCSECVVNWWPYQAKGWLLPALRRRHDAPSGARRDDADARFALARREAERREHHAAFERFYAEREQHAA